MLEVKFKEELSPEEQLKLFIQTARQFGNPVTRFLSTREEGVAVYKVDYPFEDRTNTLVIRLKGEVRAAADLFFEREGIKVP